MTSAPSGARSETRCGPGVAPALHPLSRSCCGVLSCRPPGPHPLAPALAALATCRQDGGGGVDPNRVGGPVNHLLSDGGMSTMIGGAKGVDHGLVSACTT